MRQFSPRRLVLPALLILLSASGGMAAQRPIVSSMQNVRAVTESRGYFITPAHALTGQIIHGDEAPAQAFEIVRPNDSRVTIGRLFTSCSCIQLEATKTTFERGEPVMLTLRNVKPTPPSGLVYAIYVQLISPVRVTLRYDTFVQSDRFIVPEPVEVDSARSQDVSDTEDTALREALDTAPGLTDESTIITSVQTEGAHRAPRVDGNDIAEESLKLALPAAEGKDADKAAGEAVESADAKTMAGDVNETASQKSDG